MKQDFDCLGFGICAADYLSVVPKYPKLDEKTEAVDFSYQGGGPVATAMVTVARLGFKTSYIGKVGKDADGRFVLKQFVAQGVDTTGVIVAENMPTNRALIWIDQETGKKSIVLNGNQYRSVTLEELFLDHIRSLKFMLIDGRDTEATFELIRWAKSKKAKIVIDAGSPRNQMDSILSAVEYPVVSQSFCHKYLQTADYKYAIKKMLELGATAAVVTCGDKGCYGGDSTGVYFQPAFNVDVVDTTGAGDVFHGAFVAGLIKEMSLTENLKFASAIAAIKCTQLGGRRGIPTFEMVNSFLHKNEILGGGKEK